MEIITALSQRRGDLNERGALRKAAHTLAELAKTGTERTHSRLGCGSFLDVNKSTPLPLGLPLNPKHCQLACSVGTSRLCLALPALMTRLASLKFLLTCYCCKSSGHCCTLEGVHIWRAAEDNVDVIVEAGAVPAVVPLLSLYAIPADGEAAASTSTRCARCHTTQRWMQPDSLARARLGSPGLSLFPHPECICSQSCHSLTLAHARTPDIPSRQ